MDHARGVEVVEAAEHLIEEVLDVLAGQRLLRVDNAVQVGVQKIRNYIHVVKIVFWLRREEVHHADHVVMVEGPKEVDLAHNTLRVHQIFKRVGNLFDRHFAVA